MSANQTQNARIGHFCWTDLACRDLTTAEGFYHGLFGWSVKTVDMGGGRAYTLFVRGEDEICGAYQMSPEQVKAGTPSCWTCYILVENVVESTSRAKQYGGGVLVEPFDMGTKGRMSVLVDPGKVTVALWQDVSGQSVVQSGVGSICWYELLALDSDLSKIFYSSLLGWKRRLLDMAGSDYSVFSLEQREVAGMIELTEQAKAQGTLPQWLFYVAVKSCDETASKALKIGGSLVFAPTDFPGVGRAAIVKDPVGGLVGVLQASQEPVTASQ
jgi:predicted enzyme related to lactoylglutathione lyase